MITNKTWGHIGVAYEKALEIPIGQMPDRLANLPKADEPYRRFLYFLARELKAIISLELGVYMGVGLAHLAAGSATAVGVDKVDLGFALLEPFYNCRVQIDDSINFLRSYLGPQFNIIHIDTIHQPSHVAQELELALSRIADDGVICIDDIDYSEDMWAWWQSLKLPKRNLKGLHATGFGVIVPNG